MMPAFGREVREPLPMRHLAEETYPNAERIRLVCDSLSNHSCEI